MEKGNLPPNVTGCFFVDYIKLKPKHEAGFNMPVAHGKLLRSGLVTLCGEE